MVSGAAVKQELLASAGGGLTSSQAAAALGITRQAVDKRRSRRALLAVPNGSGDDVFPACQFTPEGMIAGLPDVLRAFPMQIPWTQLSALLASSPALREKTILQALKSGDSVAAIGVAEAFGEQGA